MLTKTKNLKLSTTKRRVDLAFLSVISVIVLVFISVIAFKSINLIQQSRKENRRLADATLNQINLSIEEMRLYNPNVDYSEKINEIKSEVDPEKSYLLAKQLETEVFVSKKRLYKLKKIEEKKKAEEATAKKAAEDKAKAEAEAKKVEEQKKKAQASTVKPVYKTPAPATGFCAKNEYYVVVNVSTNSEQVMMGDPDCRTGNVVESRRVATGMQQYLWNPGGWSYWGGTPTGKWKIISKEQTSGQFGPWFLRLHYLNGGYVDQYALHGTDDPSSIGNWASHGCIRHYNEDIVHLASILSVGTVVWTVN